MSKDSLLYFLFLYLFHSITPNTLLEHLTWATFFLVLCNGDVQDFWKVTCRNQVRNEKVWRSGDWRVSWLTTTEICWFKCVKTIQEEQLMMDLSIGGESCQSNRHDKGVNQGEVYIILRHFSSTNFPWEIASLVFIII